MGLKKHITFMFFAILAASCSCQYGIGITGREDTSADSISDQTWDTPIENLGEPGWRDSTEPFCRSPEWNVWPWDVWSDSRGVFVLVMEANPGPTGWPTEDPEEAPARYYLAHNDGTGWSRYFDGIGDHGMMYCMTELSGVPGGPLVLMGTDTHYCESLFETGGLFEFSIIEASAVFVVDESLAYAVRPGGLLIYYDGSSWGPYPPDPLPHEAFRIWADETVLFVASRDGIIMSEEDGGWRIHDTHTLENISTIWGFDENDVWAGTEWGKLLHWDGVTWEMVDWPAMGDPTDPTACEYREESIRGMWGKDGVLYFHSGKQITMWDGFEFTVIGYWPGEDVWYPETEGHDCLNAVGINSIWGNSPNEVFLAVSAQSHATEDCAPQILLWWDGSEFHWF